MLALPARLEPVRENKSTLADIIEMILDKGLVINADISISLVGVDLLDIKVRAALASFETAAKYGLEMPTGTKVDMPAWRDGQEGKEICPECGKRVDVKELLNDQCPWCGWESARSKRRVIKGCPALQGVLRG